MRLAALLALVLGSVATAEESITIPFELEANLIWVQVRLDGKGPFRMAWDTGASTSVLLPEVAEKEELLQKGGPEVFEGLRFVNVRELRLGDISEGPVKIAVMNVPQLSVPTEQMRVKADGVLGFNFISRWVSTIDYATRRITLKKSTFVPPDPEQGMPGFHAEPSGWLGVQVAEADPRDVRRLGYDGGLEVNDVTELSPAEAAGIHPGDIIVDIAGTPVIRASSLRDFLRRTSPGQKIVITFVRAGELWEADVVIGKPRESDK
jgi:hypothetical protein